MKNERRRRGSSSVKKRRNVKENTSKKERREESWRTMTPVKTRRTRTRTGARKGVQKILRITVGEPSRIHLLAWHAYQEAYTEEKKSIRVLLLQ